MIEVELLKWIHEGGKAQYGECQGSLLNSLIEKGEAEILHGREHQSGFIAQGDDIEYQAVVLTDKGRARLKEAGP
jgi:hypothetical protein